MKEYKIVSARFQIENTKKSVSGFADINASIKQFFFINNNQFNPQNVENLMQKMNQDGWEVVSVAPNPATFQTYGEVIIIFEREL